MGSSSSIEQSSPPPPPPPPPSSSSSESTDGQESASPIPEPPLVSIPRRLSIFPRYVKYVPTLHCVKEEYVKVWWFPSDFCQSRLGDRVIGSNACTLIATILAHRIEGHPISIQEHDADRTLSRSLINALAESIVDGNEIHEDLINGGKQTELNLNLPEAMRACVEYNYSDTTTNGRRLTEFKSVFHMNQTVSSLFEDVHSGIVEFETTISSSPPNFNLFMVLISDTLSVLMVYQKRIQQVTLIDTHGHGELGAVVAQVTIDELQELCNWYLEMRYKMYNRRPNSYELSFLYFKS